MRASPEACPVLETATGTSLEREARKDVKGPAHAGFFTNVQGAQEVGPGTTFSNEESAL